MRNLYVRPHCLNDRQCDATLGGGGFDPALLPENFEWWEGKEWVSAKGIGGLVGSLGLEPSDGLADLPIGRF
jgi:hypothetical protein